LFSILAEKDARLMGIADLSEVISEPMQTGVSVAVLRLRMQRFTGHIRGFQSFRFPAAGC